MRTALPPLILASTSPYRRELLQRLQIPFTVAKPGADESRHPGESPAALASRLSEAKARAVAASHPDALIIGSDQVAHIADEIFGKPGNHDTAVAQLMRLSGKVVTFTTGLCLYNAKKNIAHSRLVPIEVRFRSLDQHTIEHYLHREQPYDCAGSAKSEGLGIALLEYLRGDDPNALVGLPLIALCDLLGEENYPLF